MAQKWICPYWIVENRNRGDLGYKDYQLTEVHITNPSDLTGRIELLFHEARGDGSFVRADWASGTWDMPAKYQRNYRPDPSRTYGTSFFIYGWFEAFTDLDALVIDVRVAGINRSTDVPGSEGISQRTIHLTPQALPLSDRLFRRWTRKEPYLPLIPGMKLPGEGGSVVPKP